MLSGFSRDLFTQLVRTHCKPMNDIGFCPFEQAGQKSLRENSGFRCNMRARGLRDGDKYRTASFLLFVIYIKYLSPIRNSGFLFCWLSVLCVASRFSGSANESWCSLGKLFLWRRVILTDVRKTLGHPPPLVARRVNRHPNPEACPPSGFGVFYGLEKLPGAGSGQFFSTVKRSFVAVVLLLTQFVPVMLSGFSRDLFTQLARTPCKPMNNIGFCPFEQSGQKSLRENSGFRCNIRVSGKSTWLSS